MLGTWKVGSKGLARRGLRAGPRKRGPLAPPAGAGAEPGPDSGSTCRGLRAARRRACDRVSRADLTDQQQASWPVRKLSGLARKLFAGDLEGWLEGLGAPRITRRATEARAARAAGRSRCRARTRLRFHVPGPPRGSETGLRSCLAGCSHGPATSFLASSKAKRRPEARSPASTGCPGRASRCTARTRGPSGRSVLRPGSPNYGSRVCRDRFSWGARVTDGQGLWAIPFPRVPRPPLPTAPALRGPCARRAPLVRAQRPSAGDSTVVRGPPRAFPVTACGAVGVAVHGGSPRSRGPSWTFTPGACGPCSVGSR